MALDRFNRTYGKKIRGFPSEALAVLLSHAYPGNVRELLNLVKRAMILCRDEAIGAELLPAELATGSALQTPPPVSRKRPKAEHLQQVLRHHKGNRPPPVSG